MAPNAPPAREGPSRIRVVASTRRRLDRASPSPTGGAAASHAVAADGAKAAAIRFRVSASAALRMSTCRPARTVPSIGHEVSEIGTACDSGDDILDSPGACNGCRATKYGFVSSGPFVAMMEASQNRGRDDAPVASVARAARLADGGPRIRWGRVSFQREAWIFRHAVGYPLGDSLERSSTCALVSSLEWKRTGGLRWRRFPSPRILGYGAGHLRRKLGAVGAALAEPPRRQHQQDPDRPLDPELASRAPPR